MSKLALDASDRIPLRIGRRRPPSALNSTDLRRAVPEAVAAGFLLTLPVCQLSNPPVSEAVVFSIGLSIAAIGEQSSPEPRKPRLQPVRSRQFRSSDISAPNRLPRLPAVSEPSGKVSRRKPDMPRVEMSPSNFAGRKVNTVDICAGCRPGGWSGGRDRRAGRRSCSTRGKIGDNNHPNCFRDGCRPDRNRTCQQPEPAGR